LLTHNAGCNGECEPSCPVRLLGEQSGSRRKGNIYGEHKPSAFTGHNDTGTAARFFPQFHWTSADDVPFLYCPKPSRAEREAGLEGMPECEREGTSGVNRPTRVCLECGRTKGGAAGGCQCGPTAIAEKPCAARRNTHPTVKPLALMEWLVRLVCPPGGVCLDPFLGSGTTVLACFRAGRDFIGIEKEPAYVAIAEKRLAAARAEEGLFAGGC
jgi:site-specific DNA-methyltransferase (adenine-specific)